MRYDFVRDAERWKIDDIEGGADGRPWSVRGMLTASLKFQRQERPAGPAGE